jgi:tetratricopeptide (TPR) repeat protein
MTIHEDNAEPFEIVVDTDLMQAELEAAAATLHLIDDLDEAAQLVRAAARRVGAYGGPDVPHVIDLLINLADLAIGLDLLDVADPLLARALSAQQARYPEDDSRLIGTLTAIGLLRSRSGELKDAASHLRRAVQISDRRGPPDRDTLKALRALAIALQHQGQLDESCRTSERLVCPQQIERAGVGPQAGE